jgi:hypothetical protein
MKIVIAFTGALLLAAPFAAHAADAEHPYSNIDHRYDAGNNTGDSQVDRLNEAQLESNGSPGPMLPPRQTVQPRSY